MKPVVILFWLLSVSAAITDLPGLAQAQAIKPFKIHIEEAVIVDLKDRLARTRWPEPIPGSGWDHGVEIGYLRQLAEYWRTSYDWRKHERALNEFPQFTTEIDGVPIHFIHQRSKSTGALPLVIIHGWPGSIYEFHSAASHRGKSSGCGIVPPNSTTSGPTARFRARGRRRWVTP
jgi:epoxide hydrolase-like protein